MKLLIDQSKKIHFYRGGNATDSIKGDQVDTVEVCFLNSLGNAAALAGNSTAILLALKTSASAETVLASCSSWALSGNVYTGKLNLANDAVRALSDSAKVLIEVRWAPVDGEPQRTDNAWITIQRAAIAGDESVPLDGSAGVRAAFFEDNVVQGANITLTVDPETGKLTISGAAASSVAWADITGKPSSFTPSAHAASHASGGSDPLTVAQSQVTGLTDALAAKLPSNGSAAGLSGVTQGDAAAIAAAIAGIALGKIKQVVTAPHQNAAGPFSGQSWSTAMTASITPTSASNKIIVISSGCYSGTVGGQHYGRLCNGSTPIMAPATAGTRTGVHGGFRTEAATHIAHMTMIAEHSPASTAAQTYNSQVTSQQGAHTTYLNRTITDTDGAWTYPRAASMLILLEVAP